MIDWPCNMVTMNHIQIILLEDVDKDINIAADAHIGQVDSKVVDNLL